MPFTSRQDLRTLHQQAREAWHRGMGTVDFRGKSILVDASFIQALDELVTESLPLLTPSGKINPQRALPVSIATKTI